MRPVAVLFARPDSVYKTLPGLDVWDAERDARQWPGGCAVVAHPPCAQWGKLRAFARINESEKMLAPWAVGQVRAHGGVLEHPVHSKLWEHCDLPRGAARDSFGGWTLVIDQDWFGHRAEKRTALYIVGCAPARVPAFPLKLEEPTHVLTQWKGMRAGMAGCRPEITKAEREHTPIAMAQWLVSIARSS